MRKRRFIRMNVLLLSALLLIAGAAVNVAVVAGLIAVQREPLKQEMTWCEIEAMIDAVERSKTQVEVTAAGFTLTHSYIPGDGNAERATHLPGIRYVVRVSGLTSDGRLLAGWPLLANSRYWPQPIQRSNDGKKFVRQVLPLQPVWPGFAVNAMLYAALLWMLWVFPFMLRRRIRIKRGLCPACAYPIGTSPVCTECGNEVICD